MKRVLPFLLCVCVAAVSMAQDRYLEEVFTDSEITISKNIPYGINVNPLLNTSLLDPSYVGANAVQITMEKDSLVNIIAADDPIPASFLTPFALDSSTLLKVTTLEMDVYMPDMSVDTETERPVIVYVHTGNFLPPVVNGSYGGSKEDSSAVELCKRWAKRGFVAVAPNYRHGWNPVALGPEGLITRRATLLNAVYRAIHDVQYCVKGLREDATDYGIDEDNFAMYGSGSGGYIALAYNTLDDQAGTQVPKFVFGGNSIVVPSVVGDVNGEGGLINLYQDNGFSDDVDMTVNAGGALGELSWMDASDAPLVTFHSPYDQFAPFDTGTVIVPTTNDDVVDVNGPNTFMVKANALGLNSAYSGTYTDAYTARASSFHGRSMSNSPVINVNDPIEIPDNGDVEGLFTVVVRDGNGDIEPNGSPWDWWSMSDLTALVSATNAATNGSYDANEINTNSMATNPNQSPTQGRVYIDTIIGYMIPRVVKTLQIGNWQSVNVDELYMDREDVNVYPNPATTTLTVKASSPTMNIASYEIFDMMGRTVKAETGLNEYLLELGVEDMNTGLYMGNFTLDSGETIVKRFTVE